MKAETQKIIATELREIIRAEGRRVYPRADGTARHRFEESAEEALEKYLRSRGDIDLKEANPKTFVCGFFAGMGA